jgi:hypothetical protein
MATRKNIRGGTRTHAEGGLESFVTHAVQSQHSAGWLCGCPFEPFEKLIDLDPAFLLYLDLLMQFSAYSAYFRG